MNVWFFSNPDSFLFDSLEFNRLWFILISFHSSFPVGLSWMNGHWPISYSWSLTLSHWLRLPIRTALLLFYSSYPFSQPTFTACQLSWFHEKKLYNYAGILLFYLLRIALPQFSCYKSRAEMCRRYYFTVVVFHYRCIGTYLFFLSCSELRGPLSFKYRTIVAWCAAYHQWIVAAFIKFMYWKDVESSCFK